MADDKKVEETEVKEHQCDHDHDHEHDHDHHHDSDSEGEVKGEAKGKQNRGEKKCRKAMTKLGMKPVPGINRVTFKKGKNMYFVIQNPDVMKSPGNDDSYIIFGEAKFEDGGLGNLAEEAKKFQKAEAAGETAVKEETETKVDEKKEEEDDNEEVDETGLNPETIDMVMQHTSCSRPKAVKALREANGEMIDAIVKLTG
eukprot:CAMPEP_0114989112 /NCGR_PEP_ID=MMETSP0216-20121206/10005_1 /TAXON_ID=223996 /ORGANISM="Protocruzia adherens, Strain Boccale" /LENGTH=198 /DNA_ID=CAMNT_0002352031 /DNA_START=3002 /DNA_END=3598 /DNA_ORIENTATION=+